MQLPEARGSQKDREMILVANGTLKNKSFDVSQKKKKERTKIHIGV